MHHVPQVAAVLHEERIAQAVFGVQVANHRGRELLAFLIPRTAGGEMDQHEGDRDDKEENRDQPQDPPDDVQAQAGRSAPGNLEGEEGAPRWGALCYGQSCSFLV